MREKIKFRVQLPSNGKFYRFTSLFHLFEHFTTDELRSMEAEDASNMAIIVKGTIVGYISLRNAFSALNGFNL